MKRTAILFALLVSAVLSGCALEPWSEADHRRYANRYCGGMKNYDPHWWECKKGSALVQAPGTKVYTVTDADKDSIGGVIWSRD